MAQAEKNSPSRNPLSTWLIFGVLGLAATFCGLVLPHSLRSIRDAVAAIPPPQPPPQPSENAVSPVGTPMSGETPVPPARVIGTGVSPDQTKDTLQYDPPDLPEMPPLKPMLLRLALGTVLVLILCIFTLGASKRWVRPLAAPINQGRKLRILESLALGGRCSVLLLQAEEAKILVGMDPSGIKTLLPLPKSFDRALEELFDGEG
jgi:flagellar biogenesis protein FliO